MLGQKITTVGVVSALILSSALPVFAQDTTVTSTADNAGYVQCVQSAVVAHDASVLVAHNKKSESFKVTLKARTDATVSALAITNTDEKKAALKKAQVDFRAAMDLSHKNFKVEMKASQETLKTNRKECAEKFNIVLKQELKDKREDRKLRLKERRDEGKLERGNNGLGSIRSKLRGDNRFENRNIDSDVNVDLSLGL